MKSTDLLGIKSPMAEEVASSRTPQEGAFRLVFSACAAGIWHLRCKAGGVSMRLFYVRTRACGVR